MNRKLLLIFLLLPNILFARKFYFSSTGSDSYSSTQAQNPATPWQTLQKLETLSNSGVFTAGDTIAFKRGDVFDNGFNNIYNASCTWKNTGAFGGTAPSGTQAHPIVFTNYGDVNLALPNMLYPAVSPLFPSGTRMVFCFEGVSWIVMDGLQFNDDRVVNITAADKTGVPLATGGIVFGVWTKSTSTVMGSSSNPASRIRMISNCTLKNCYFNNMTYGLWMVAGINTTITNNTFVNMKCSKDTGGINDVLGCAIEACYGFNLNISNNYFKGSWAMSGITGSSHGIGGVAIDLFTIRNSRIAYNTIIDCSGFLEMGNIDIYDTTTGAQYDTFAYNKIINSGQIAYLHGVVGDPFKGHNKGLAFWNNVIIENNTSRMVGAGFGLDTYSDGQSFAQNWFWGGATTCSTIYCPNNPSSCNQDAYRAVIAYKNPQLGNPDTLIDSRNNIIYNTTGTQMIYEPARTEYKRNNNIYYLAGKFGSYNTRLGGAVYPSSTPATLSTGEIQTTSNVFLDTLALHPENWDLRLGLGSQARGTGTPISGFTVDFAGNPINNPPNMGLFENISTITSPTVTTTAAFSINTNIATTGGNVTTDGGSPITRRGLMYSLAAITDTTTGTKVIDGSLGIGSFTTSLTGLTPSTQYHVRAFALNSVGVSYGADLTFTTLAVIIPPTVTTTPASSIGLTTATTGGNVTTNGGATVISRGILYSLTAIPSDTTSSTKINSGNGTGVFTTSLTSLAGGTLYHIRAFAVNSAGVSFGADLTFTTITTPTVTTTSPTGIGQIIATSGGNVISNGGSAVTRRGLVYSLSPISDTSGGTRLIDAGVGNGAYVTTISGLVANTTYHIRAFAVNLAGVSLGADLTFTTLVVPVLPIVSTITSNVTNTSALVYNNVSSEGSSSVTRRGLVWSINPVTDTTSGTKVIDAGAGLGNYTSIISGLSAGTTYYSKAFAVNSVGVAYGSQYSFTTYAKPTVVTTSPTSITSTSANGTGNVTSDGGSSVYRRGIIYNTSPLVDTTSGGKIIDANVGLGSFSLPIIPLVSNRTYYVMAFAVNSIGVSYGANLTFNTLMPPLVPVVPTITTSPATSITTSSAISGGNITLDGGASVFRRGLMYSTTPITDTTTGTKIIAGTSGVGSFNISLTSLSINTKYYIRAFALNSAGISYGSELNFTITTNSFKTRKKFVQSF